MLEVGLEWEPPTGVIERANEVLARFSPRSEVLPWNYAYWEAGESWCPVERIVVAQMMPAAHLYAEHNLGVMWAGHGQRFFTKLSELNGPSPREGGYFDSVKKKFIYRVDPITRERYSPTITLRQWNLWREQGALAEPMWIVQGSNGGHKRRFTDFEEKLNQMAGRPKWAPVPGELPYAPFDNRVLAAIEVAKVLHDFGRQLSSDWYMTASQSDSELESGKPQPTDADKKMYSLYNDWLDKQTEDAVSRRTGLEAARRTQHDVISRSS